ncbi:MAG: hypothetical protein ONB45_04835 [candidate division KSB1 bacterium]|nr:hypothetical protein [candidate division KSB1 bacterium]
MPIIIFGCTMENLPFERSGYLFVESLIHPATGLAASREGECATTVYTNALAAMVFLHEGNRPAAEKIFEIFKKYYYTQQRNFHGLPQVWDPCSGLPDTFSVHWEGETAFLLLALNYYRQVTGSYEPYQDLAQGLAVWLAQRANMCEQLVAEGVANMYAALLPFADDPMIEKSTDRLRACFFSKGQISSAEYAHCLEHVVRGALIFGDTTGFRQIPGFARSETWDFDHTTRVSAFSAYKDEQSINVELSAQLLLMARIWQPDLPFDLTSLRGELEKLRLRGKSQPSSIGLPYFVAERGFENACALPIIQPTSYLLFCYWDFNPFAPGKKCAAELPHT